MMKESNAREKAKVAVCFNSEKRMNTVRRQVAALLAVLIGITAMPLAGIGESNIAQALARSQSGAASIQAESALMKKSGMTALSAEINKKDVQQMLKKGQGDEYGALKFYLEAEDENVGKTTVTIKKELLKTIYKNTDVPLEVESSLGKVSLNRNLLKYLYQKAEGDTVDIIMAKKVLTEKQQESFGSESFAMNVYFTSGGKKIKNLQSNRVEIEFYLYGETELNDVSGAYRLKNDGKLLKTEYNCEKDENGRTICKIKEKYLYPFVIGESTKLKTARIIAGVKTTKIEVSVKGIAKGCNTLQWTKSKGFALDGYLVYDAYGKNENYTKKYDTEENSCINKGIESGKFKYYKVRGYRVIDGKTYYTKWSNIVSATAL